MSALEHLEPKSVFHFFEELCRIPRATFDTKRVSDYCVDFAKERGLECIQDEANNVIIKKAGTALPSHMHLQFLTVTRLNIRRLKQSLPQMKKLEWVAQEQSIFLY